jgi:hypothetical protein
MGFLDKLQQTAKETLDKGKEKLEDVQADRTADKLLRDLGAWYYAGRTGRDSGEAAGNVERLVAELQAHEAEHGPLGAKDEEAAAPAPPPPGPPPSAPPPGAPPSAPPPPGAPPSAPPPPESPSAPPSAPPPGAPPSAPQPESPSAPPSAPPPVAPGPPPPPAE